MDIARPGGRRPRRLVEAFSSPDSYGLVLLLILITYALSAIITAAWAVSLVLVVQIATVWVTLRVSRAHRLARVIANAILVIAALAALVNLFIHQETTGMGLLAALSGLLYLVAPVSIVRHLALRRTVDLRTYDNSRRHPHGFNGWGRSSRRAVFRRNRSRWSDHLAVKPVARRSAHPAIVRPDMYRSPRGVVSHW
jgi:hypothetical protein